MTAFVNSEGSIILIIIFLVFGALSGWLLALAIKKITNKKKDE